MSAFDWGRPYAPPRRTMVGANNPDVRPGTSGYMEVTGPNGTQTGNFPGASSYPVPPRPRTTSSARRPGAQTPGGVPGRAGMPGNTSPDPGTGQNAQQAVQQRRQNYAQTMGASYGPRTAPQPGAPVNGIVGTPDLGTVSELNRWAGQVPGGMEYLRSIGMAPNVQTMQVGDMGTSRGGNSVRTMNRMAQQNDGWSPQDQAASAALMPGGVPQPATSGGFRPAGPGAKQGGSLEQQLESGVKGMLQNPTGYNSTQEQQLRNRAVDPISQQMMEGMEDVRADAARRGAATSDADIRDQLGRVRSDAAMSASDASFNVDKALADLGRQGRLGAIGAGNSLLQTQLQNARSQQELELMLQQMEAENAQNMGPQSGLANIFG